MIALLVLCAVGNVGVPVAAAEAPTIVVGPSPLPVAPLLQWSPMSMSCTDQCRAEYGRCLDDCDAWPFPGCYDFCRFDILYPCYAACFGG